MGIESPFVTVTYKQLSDTLGISYHATLQRVKRNKTWIKSSNNRGNTTIKIPRHDYVTLRENVTKNETSNDVTNKGHSIATEENSTLDGIKAISRAYENERKERISLQEKVMQMGEELASIRASNTVLKRQKANDARKLTEASDKITKVKEDLRLLEQKHEHMMSRSWWRRLLGVP